MGLTHFPVTALLTAGQFRICGMERPEWAERPRMQTSGNFQSFFFGMACSSAIRIFVMIAAAFIG